jgi:hypothetical protein
VVGNIPEETHCYGMRNMNAAQSNFSAAHSALVAPSTNGTLIATFLPSTGISDLIWVVNLVTNP